MPSLRDVRTYARTPGRYVGTEEVENDGVPSVEKMESLTREIGTQFHESEELQSAIREKVPSCSAIPGRRLGLSPETATMDDHIAFATPC